MHPPFTPSRHALSQGAESREGRDCESSHRLTAMLLFPELDARPGGWLLVLVAACCYVAIRALELGRF